MADAELEPEYTEAEIENMRNMEEAGAEFAEQQRLEGIARKEARKKAMAGVPELPEEVIDQIKEAKKLRKDHCKEMKGNLINEGMMREYTGVRDEGHSGGMNIVMTAKSFKHMKLINRFYDIPSEREVLEVMRTCIDILPGNIYCWARWYAFGGGYLGGSWTVEAWEVADDGRIRVESKYMSPHMLMFDKNNAKFRVIVQSVWKEKPADVQADFFTHGAKAFFK